MPPAGSEKLTSITVTFVVEGQPHTDTFPSNEALRGAVQKVLAATGHTGQTAEKWVLKFSDKEIKDLNQSFSDAGIGNGARLTLNPRTGRGG